jgi:cbb3-type cytochrome oxidase subunit 3
MILTTIYGLVTLSLIIAFILLVIWAFSPAQRSKLQLDANIPFLNDKQGE